MPRRNGTANASTDAEDPTTEDTAQEDAALDTPRRMMVVHGVHVARPTGKKDKDGNPIYKGFRPEIGKVFDFTEEEYRDLMRMSPGAIRDPKNEDDSEPVAEPLLPGAAGDAAAVARTAAVGRARLPSSESTVGDDENDL